FGERLGGGERFIERGERFACAAEAQESVGEEAEVVSVIGPAAGGVPGIEAAADFGDAGLRVVFITFLSVVGLFSGADAGDAGPAAEDQAAGEPKRKTFLGGEIDAGLRPLCGRGGVATELVKHCGKVHGQRETAGLIEPAS